MPKIVTMQQMIAVSSFFGEADISHSNFQMELYPTNGHIHACRGVNSYALYEPLHALQGFKNSSIQLQAYAKELFDQIKGSLFI